MKSMSFTVKYQHNTKPFQVLKVNCKINLNGTFCMQTMPMVDIVDFVATS